MRRSRRQRTTKCKRCRKPITVAAKGRIPTYCGQACKQRAYERRKHRGPLFALIEDIHAMKLQHMIQTEVRRFLERAGGVDTTAQPKPTVESANLRLVVVNNPDEPKQLTKDHPPSDPEGTGS